MIKKENLDIYLIKKDDYSKDTFKSILNKVTKNDDLEISYNKFGKPFFNNYRDLFFNKSDKDEIIALAFNDNEIGVDIESINIKYPNIKKYFNKYNYNENLLWSIIESSIKFLGLSAFSFKDFSIINIDYHNNMYYSIVKYKEERTIYVTSKINDLYFISVASNKNFIFNFINV
ncbi:MAG TPA: hypothetical protein DEA28_02570 [Firmicutes bacterium]|nr:hypothetical protein [Bacillota bacterium]